MLLINLVILLIPAGLASLASARLSRSSHDEWQLMAWIPTLPLLIWGAIIAVAVTRDPHGQRQTQRARQTARLDAGLGVRHGGARASGRA
jgi:hypothetical protein